MMDVETSAELGSLVSEYLDRNEFPDDLRSLLNETTVLSGGTIVKAIMEIYPEIPVYENELYINDIRALSIQEINPIEIRKDFDIYTTRSSEELTEYLQVHGYELGFRCNFDRGIVVFYREYGSWIIRAKKGSVNVDFMLINKVRKRMFQGGFYRTPQEFIIKEFDLDICKIWFDGINIEWDTIGSLTQIQNRKMSLVFHPGMTINSYKRKTTANRIIKYRDRGFAFIVNDTFHGWFKKYLYDVMPSISKIQGNVPQIEVLVRCIKKIVNFDDVLTKINKINTAYLHLTEIMNDPEFTEEEYDFLEAMENLETLTHQIFIKYTDYGLFIRLCQIIASSNIMRISEDGTFPISLYNLHNGTLLKYIIRSNNPEKIYNFINELRRRGVHVTSKTIYLSIIYAMKEYTYPQGTLFTELSSLGEINIEQIGETIKSRLHIGSINTLENIADGIQVLVHMGIISENFVSKFTMLIIDYPRNEFEINFIHFVTHGRNASEFNLDPSTYAFISVHALSDCVKHFTRRMINSRDADGIIDKTVDIVNEIRGVHRPDYNEHFIKLMRRYFHNLRTFHYPNAEEIHNVISRCVSEEFAENYLLIPLAGPPPAIFPIVFPEGSPESSSRQVQSGERPVAVSPITPSVLMVHDSQDANYTAKDMILHGNFPPNVMTDIYIRYDVLPFNHAYSLHFGALVLLWTIAGYGKILNRLPKIYEQSRRIKLAEYLSRDRPIPGHDVPCKNFDRDYVSLESFSDFTPNEYMVMCVSYGQNVTFYCVMNDTIDKMFMIMIDEGNTFSRCEKVPTDAGGFHLDIIRNDQFTAPFPFDNIVFIDIYSFYKIWKALRLKSKNELLVAYIEMTSADVLMFSEFGIGRLHGEEGDERTVFALGKIVCINTETQERRILDV